METDDFLKCVVDTNRRKIIDCLKNKEKSVNEIVKKLSLEQSLVSHHLQRLRCCGVVTTKQNGKQILYRLADPEIYTLLKRVTELSKKIPLKTECCNHE
jgi:DNA-binding transcriptional ArsR family regulator